VTASQVLAATPQAAPSRYALVLTTEPEAVRAAQRLRHRVFADEPGARLTTDEPGVDVDRFDAFCDHLIVREERTGEVVGTYRMLPPERARAAAPACRSPTAAARDARPGGSGLDACVAVHAGLPARTRAPELEAALPLTAVAAVLLTALITVPLAGDRWLAACCRALLRAAGVRPRVTPVRAWDAWSGVLVGVPHGAFALSR
jgi:hypothetical protein